MTHLQGKHILLILTGGIAAYKVLDLIRMLRRHDAKITAIMTQSAKDFVTPLSVAALTGEKVYDNDWSLTDEVEMGHIQLSRCADFILIAPATANFLAKITHGLADDLASTLCLASDKPIIAAPAMNIRMWENAATQDNLALLRQRGITIIPPAKGAMACGEWGEGRLPEPQEIIEALQDFLGGNAYPALKGKKALVTAGATIEPIDPVRYISNHSSGKQGYEIAKALYLAGVETTLISGPTHIQPPAGVKLISVQTADQMLAACQENLPVDIAICCAAVADWKVSNIADQKIKKTRQQTAPKIEWQTNPDILHILAQAGNKRPQILVGFAAETENLIENARQKLENKQCDVIVANDVSAGQAFGADHNKVTILQKGQEPQDFPDSSKQQVAQNLLKIINDRL